MENMTAVNPFDWALLLLLAPRIEVLAGRRIRGGLRRARLLALPSNGAAHPSGTIIRATSSGTIIGHHHTRAPSGGTRHDLRSQPQVKLLDQVVVVELFR